MTQAHRMLLSACLVLALSLPARALTSSGGCTCSGACSKDGYSYTWCYTTDNNCGYSGFFGCALAVSRTCCAAMPLVSLLSLTPRTSCPSSEEIGTTARPRHRHHHHLPNLLHHHRRLLRGHRARRLAHRRHPPQTLDRTATESRPAISTAPRATCAATRRRAAMPTPPTLTDAKQYRVRLPRTRRRHPVATRGHIATRWRRATPSAPLVTCAVTLRGVACRTLLTLSGAKQRRVHPQARRRHRRHRLYRQSRRRQRHHHRHVPLMRPL